MGDPDAARPHALVLQVLADRRSSPRQLVINCISAINILSCLEGDWEAGREYTGRVLEVSPLNPQHLLSRVLLEHESGDSVEGEVYLERLREAASR